MGLIGGMARTAVVAGTATAVGNRVSRRQAQRWGTQTAYAGGEVYPTLPPQQQQQPQYAPPPPPPPPAADDGFDLTEELTKLANLHTQGILSDEEFAAAKAKLLGS